MTGTPRRALNGLGEASFAAGELVEATEHHRRALVLAREIGLRREQSRAEDGIGRAGLATGRFGDTRTELVDRT